MSIIEEGYLCWEPTLIECPPCLSFQGNKFVFTRDQATWTLFTFRRDSSQNVVYTITANDGKDMFDMAPNGNAILVPTIPKDLKQFHWSDKQLIIVQNDQVYCFDSSLQFSVSKKRTYTKSSKCSLSRWELLTKEQVEMYNRRDSFIQSIHPTLNTESVHRFAIAYNRILPRYENCVPYFEYEFRNVEKHNMLFNPQQVCEIVIFQLLVPLMKSKPNGDYVCISQPLQYIRFAESFFCLFHVENGIIDPIYICSQYERSEMFRNLYSTIGFTDVSDEFGFLWPFVAHLLPSRSTLTEKAAYQMNDTNRQIGKTALEMIRPHLLSLYIANCTDLN